MPSEKDQFGLRGEQMAERALKKMGMRLLQRRYRVTAGEVDLIFRSRQTIVFVEVKTQRSTDLLDPHERVGSTKRRRLIAAARWFVNAEKLHEHPLRFDIVAVTLPDSGPPQVKHYPDAFVPTRW